MILREFTQKSRAWLLWRNGGVGSSDAPAVVNGRQFQKTRKGVWREKTSPVREVSSCPGNWAMAQGNRVEPELRAWYVRAYGGDPQPVCGEHEEFSWLRASFDGWDASRRLVLEIKYASRDKHEDALAGRVPRDYLPQCNHLWLCASPLHFHYLSFNPRFPAGEQRQVVEYVPDADALREHLAACEAFWRCVLTRTEPE